MKYSLEQSVIRIFGEDNRALGTGTVLSSNLAVTCIHVVHGANKQVGDSLRVQFLLTGSFQEAHVIPEGWSEDENVAFLALKNIPSTVSPAILGSAEGRMGHAYTLLGFGGELKDYYQAIWVHDIIVGLAFPNSSNKGHSKLQLKAEHLMSGMSGAPIFDLEVRRVVGIMNKMFIGRSIPRIGFGITSDTLATLNSELRLWPDSYGAELSESQTEELRIQLIRLRDMLSTGFNESELRDLCTDFRIEYEDLAGSQRRDKIRELIAHFERRGRTSEIIEVVRDLRPNLPFS